MQIIFQTTEKTIFSKIRPFFQNLFFQNQNQNQKQTLFIVSNKSFFNNYNGK
jgi:hypothetical protein